MMPGDTVSWLAVNGPRTGVLEEPLFTGDWLVRLPDGRHVVVNESSFRNE